MPGSRREVPVNRTTAGWWVGALGLAGGCIAPTYKADEQVTAAEPDGKVDSGTEDTGPAEDDTGAPPERPWPTVSDDITPRGTMDCPDLLTPCNHQVLMAVGDETVGWRVLEIPLATRASVAHVVPVDYGEWDGEPWGGLWVTYVDVLPENIPAEADVANVLTVATLAFPWSAVQTADDLERVLSGEGPEPWVYRRTNTWTFGETIVDPERELIQTDDGLRHLLLVIDLDLDNPPPDWDNHLLLLDSEDGVEFSLLGEVDIPNPGTDPDCSPIGFTGAYPGVLPSTWAPEGEGLWNCNVSGYNQFTPHGGTLLRQRSSGAPVLGLTVTATARRDGALRAIGHKTPSDASFPGHSDLTESTWDGSAWGTPAPVLATGEVPGTEGGLQAPNRIVLPSGPELLVFHSMIVLPG